MVDVRITSIGVRNHRDKDKESDVNHSYSASSQTMHQINHKKGTTMKSSVAILIGLAGMLCLVIPATAIAAGTPAGTVISNFATMNYKDLAGNAYPAFNSNTISITVKQVAGVAINPPTSAHTSGDSTYQTYSIVVTNTGNGTDIFDLLVGSSQNWTPQLFLDANRNGVLDASERTAGPITVTPAIAADSTLYLIARIFTPANTVDGTIDLMTVTATSQFKNTVTVSGFYTTTNSAAVVSMSNAAAPTNPQPGQPVTFTVGYSNSGTAAALTAVGSDVLSTNLTFVNGSIVAPGGTTASYNSSNRTITWTIGRIGGGQSGTLTFQVTVNAGVLAGSVISNQAGLAFTDSANGAARNITSPSTSITVAQFVSGIPTINPQTQSIDVGLNAQYRITLQNNGNGPDSTRITTSSSLGLLWTYWVDANNDGIYGNDGDYTINVSNTGKILPNGGLLNLIAVTTIPALTPDHAIDSTKFTFTSLSNPAVSGTIVGVITVKAPVMSLVKSYAVFGGGESITGAKIVFTVAYHNNGTGAAQSIIVSDIIPTHMTYVANSIKYNGTAQTDDVDGDVAQFTSGVAIVNLGNVGAGASGTIEFSALIQ